jgi:hypothetical protein
MKKNMRNALAISGLAIVLGTSGVAFDASASTLNGKDFQYERNFKKKNFLKNQNLQRHRRILFGKVISVSDNSLTMTRGQKTFTVNKISGTRVFNKNWQKINFSQIKVNDKIRVQGTLSETTISARTIRDVSL